MRFLKTFGILLLVTAIFGGAMFGLNLYTGPIIEANNAGAANDRLNAVMPGGKAYEDITQTLSGLPASVVKVSKETNGLGYVMECTATSQYTGGAPMDIVIGVDATGKICGINLVSHSESLIFGADYPSTYIGKDSALAGVELYAGSTYSSTAFKTAVEEAMGVLAANNLIAAGVKSDAQILEELIPTVSTGLVKLSEVSASGNIKKALKAGTGAGFAYIMTEGEASYLAIVNAMGACKLYNVEGAEVQNEALATEAKAHAAANQTSYAQELATRVDKMMDGASDIEALVLDTFNSVVSAVSFKVDDATYYGFYSRSYGFEQMDVYLILDASGAIVKVQAKTLIFHEEYFDGFGGVPQGYLGGFAGATGDTWTGDEALIAGATMTTNAMKEAVADTFAAFHSMNNGGEQ